MFVSIPGVYLTRWIQHLPSGFKFLLLALSLPRVTSLIRKFPLQKAIQKEVLSCKHMQCIAKTSQLAMYFHGLSTNFFLQLNLRCFVETFTGFPK